MKKKIFIIDDDKHILEALAFILRDVAYDVVTYSDGAIFPSITPEDLPDLIVMDAWLATENGIEITRVLKRSKVTEAIPVIIISADVNIERLALEAGACMFLPKPFRVETLLDAIEKAL